MTKKTIDFIEVSSSEDLLLHIFLNKIIPATGAILELVLSEKESLADGRVKLSFKLKEKTDTSPLS